MPFASRKQQKFMWAHENDEGDLGGLASKWTRHEKRAARKEKRAPQFVQKDARVIRAEHRFKGDTLHLGGPMIKLDTIKPDTLRIDRLKPDTVKLDAPSWDELAHRIVPGYKRETPVYKPSKWSRLSSRKKLLASAGLGVPTALTAAGAAKIRYDREHGLRKGWEMDRDPGSEVLGAYQPSRTPRYGLNSIVGTKEGVSKSRRVYDPEDRRNMLTGAAAATGVLGGGVAGHSALFSPTAGRKGIITVSRDYREAKKLPKRALMIGPRNAAKLALAAGLLGGGAATARYAGSRHAERWE